MPLRRDAARVAAAGDRALHERAGDGLLRHRRARPRRQPPLRDAALRRVAEVRRRGAARSARLGDRADRGPRRTLRPRRARPRRRAHRDRLGERRSGADRGGARRTFRFPAVTSATGSSTRRGSGRVWRISRSRVRHSCRRRSAPGTQLLCASGRPTAGSRSSRSARCSSGSTPSSGGCASGVAGSRSSRSGSS